jgi:hypothetical protein
VSRVERWADIPQWPYEVSSRGRVRSKHRVVMRSDGKPNTVVRRILKLSYSRAPGLASVTLQARPRKKTFSVHKLVADAFGETGA